MGSTAKPTPYLQSIDKGQQLIVNGKPFLMLGGELQNSSMTSAAYMDTVWQKLVDTHVNTVLGCVAWEDIEPIEGNFRFTELDKVIEGARRHGLHLVLLWFGSFKNGLSSYAPPWVKKDHKRFPREHLRKAGAVLKTADVVSIFHTEVRDADAIAFAKLMSHVRAVDADYSTVIMTQVENETGLLAVFSTVCQHCLLGDSRDGSTIANARFAERVPQDLIEHRTLKWDTLNTNIKSNLKVFRDLKSRSGSWETVFRKSKQTDELFTAYHYAKYVEYVAAASRKAYDIPLYTNVWQNYVGSDAENDFPVIVGGGGEPGDYPSGGGVNNVLDIWRQFAPSLDFIAPDIYLNDYSVSCQNYRHLDQPLFIPEQRRDKYGARRIWNAFGSYQAIGVSPFGIDTLEPENNAFTKHYRLLSQVQDIVLEAHRSPGSSIGFFFDELKDDGGDPTSPTITRFSDFEVTISRCFVFGKRGPGAGMLIHQGDGKFLLIGWGFQAEIKSTSSKSTFTGILSFTEKMVDEATGKLITGKKLNGDETRSGKYLMMPNEEPDYGGFPICVTIPARTMIAECEVYSLEEDSGDF